MFQIIKSRELGRSSPFPVTHPAVKSETAPFPVNQYTPRQQLPTNSTATLMTAKPALATATQPYQLQASLGTVSGAQGQDIQHSLVPQKDQGSTTQTSVGAVPGAQGQDVQHSLVPQEDQESTTQPTGVVTPSHPSLTSVDQLGIQSPQQLPVNVDQSDLPEEPSPQLEMAQGMCMCTSVSTGNCYMHTT